MRIKKLNLATLFFSNQLERLYAHLDESLEGVKAPLVIVPSPAVERWLTSRLGTSEGIPTTFLRRGIEILVRQPLCAEFTLQLTVFLAERLEMHREAPLFAAVRRYLKGEEGRRMVLAQRLAMLFSRYGLYGVTEWKHPWQHILWEESRPLFPPLSDLIQRPVFSKSVHLFGLNHLSPPLFDFFAAQGAHFYVLSPCQEFWSDVYGEARIGQETHPLLLSLGRVGQQMARYIEESGIETVEDYEEEGLSPTQASLLTFTPLEQDPSIEMYAASTPFSEVEMLYNALQPYFLDSIVIMAPDITPYVPFLRAVFGSSVAFSSQIDPSIQGLKQILELDAQRWSASSIMALLRHPLLAEKWDSAARQQIEKWIRAKGIHWGVDAAQRQALGYAFMFQGTWAAGCKRLEAELKEPEERVLLERLCCFLEALEKAYAPLRTAICTPAEWKRLLVVLYETVFGEESASLQESLPSLEQAQPMVFEAYLPLLSEVGKIGEEGDGIVCAPMQSLRGIPAQIVCLLGMHDEAFPRQGSDSLDALQSCKQIPTQADFDRFLFLETLLSYRKKLFISYQGRDPVDGSKKPPSSVLSALMPYIMHHESVFCSSPPSPVAKKVLFTPPCAVKGGTGHLEIKDFVRALRAPLRHFYHDMTFCEPAAFVEEEPLTCQPWALSRLRALSLRVPQEEAIARLQQQGALPTGPLFEAVRERITAQLALAPTCKHAIHLKLLEGVELVGELEGFVEREMWIPDQGDLVGCIKWWPLCVLAMASGVASSFFFTKDQKRKEALTLPSQPILENLVQYYFQSRVQPSPLYPAVAAYLLKQQPEQAIEALHAIHDPAAQWASSAYRFDEGVVAWEGVARSLYQEMYHAWF